MRICMFNKVHTMLWCLIGIQLTIVQYCLNDDYQRRHLISDFSFDDDWAE